MLSIFVYNLHVYFLYIFSQSETKHETKEESHLEEEGPSIIQEKLPLPLVVHLILYTQVSVRVLPHEL